jgi:hypothetical protein
MATPIKSRGPMVRFMVFNTTFNNIAVISWWSVLLVEETGVPGKNHDLLEVTDDSSCANFGIEHAILLYYSK